MQINSINNFPAFSAKTKKGNEYKKSNSGKIYTPILMLGMTGLGFVADRKNVKKYLFNSKEEPVSLIAATIAIAVAVLTAMFVGIGEIIDACSNKRMRKDVDKYAENGEVPKKTNKGKKVCAGIGLISGLASFLCSHRKASDLIAIPRELIAYTALGFIYDNSVNKFRDKLVKEKKQ